MKHIYCTNTSLILQVADYYNEANSRLDLYEELGHKELAALTRKHLMYWKRKLHQLIFNDPQEMM